MANDVCFRPAADSWRRACQPGRSGLLTVEGSQRPSGRRRSRDLVGGLDQRLMASFR